MFGALASEAVAIAIVVASVVMYVKIRRRISKVRKDFDAR